MDWGKALARAENERDEALAEVARLTATLDKVRALANAPESLLEHIGPGTVTHRRVVPVDDLRAVLDEGSDQ